jgi:hypothetical protein
MSQGRDVLKELRLVQRMSAVGENKIVFDDVSSFQQFSNVSDLFVTCKLDEISLLLVGGEDQPHLPHR